MRFNTLTSFIYLFLFFVVFQEFTIVDITKHE